MTAPDFRNLKGHVYPFSHARAPGVVSEALADAILEWFDTTADWSLRITDFYEQQEFSLLGADLPPAVACLVSPKFIGAIAIMLEQTLGAERLRLVDINAHRLTEGMTIRLHNDYLGPEETHRMLIQLNRGWSAEQGGLLMLFADETPESLADVLVPEHRSGFGFEISARSHHAVSTIHRGVRDTLVYTYRRAT